jgi:hypothetical protein
VRATTTSAAEREAGQLAAEHACATTIRAALRVEAWPAVPLVRQVFNIRAPGRKLAVRLGIPAAVPIDAATGIRTIRHATQRGALSLAFVAGMMLDIRQAV